MNKEFVPYHLALKLQEKGFREPCICSYNSFKVLKNNLAMTNGDMDDYISIYDFDTKILAPLWQQVIEWFREKRNFHIAVYKLNGKWCGEVYSIINQCYITTNSFDKILFESYEEAREHIILQAIELY